MTVFCSLQLCKPKNVWMRSGLHSYHIIICMFMLFLECWTLPQKLPGRDNGMMIGLSCAVARRWQTSWQKVMVWLLSEIPIKTLGFRAATADLRSGWLGPSWQYGSTWSGSDSASALLRVMRPLLSTSQKRCLASTMVPPPLH